jgi:hypothetical protein
VAAGVQHALKLPWSKSSDKPNISGPAPSPFNSRPSEADLAKLARWLYPLISFRLKAELRQNRERAGLLTDTYRRW